MQYQNTKKNKGFVLLYAVTLAALLLSIALGVGSVALKEINFSTSIKDADNAFYAADTGAEQALFNDKSPSYPTSNFVVSGLGSDGQSCASVFVDKSAPPTVTVTANGYNIGSAGGGCTPTNPNHVERELKVAYGNPTAPPSPPQTPFMSSFGGTSNLGVASGDFNMGYKFTPNKSGTVTQLWFISGDATLHHLRLYNMSGTVLADAIANGNNLNWVSANVTPVSVIAGTSYVVSVRGTSYCYQGNYNTPQTVGDVTISGTIYGIGSDALPNFYGSTPMMYGEADVTFVPN